MPADDTIRWLLAGDPAIRWQVLRDLAEAAERTVERERRKVARDGWGARLLAKQGSSGTWAEGLYSPKWTSTTYTLLLLRDLGLPPGGRGLHEDGGINWMTIAWMPLPRFHAHHHQRARRPALV
jgi:hypothetical protein